MKRIVYFVLIILASCSSGEKHKTELVLKNEQNEKIYEQPLLKGVQLSSDSDIPLGNIVDLVGDRIIISSYQENSVFEVYQLRGDSLIKEGQFLKRGEGPFEMVQPFAFYDKLEKCIYVYDHPGQLRTIYSIDLDNVQNLYETSSWREVRVPVIDNYFLGSWMRKMNDHSFLVLGSKVGSKNLLSRIEPADNSISELDCPYPEQDGAFNVSSVVKQGVYLTGVIERHPDLDKVVYACESGRYAEIIDLTKPEINRTLILATYPKYTAKDGFNRSYMDDCFRGMQVRVTEKYVYVLPYPLTKGDVRRQALYKNYPNYCSDELLVFNWQGELVKKYMLDTPIYTYVVDDKDCFLYAATVELEVEGETMKKYELNDLNI